MFLHVTLYYYYIELHGSQDGVRKNGETSEVEREREREREREGIE